MKLDDDTVEQADLSEPAWSKLLRGLAGTVGPTRPATLSGGLFGLLLAGSLSAQTGIINGQFDQNLAGWQLNASPSVNVSAVWSSNDAAGDPASGSAELRDLAPGNGGTQVILSQCVDLSAAVFPLPWQVSAQVLIEGEPWIRAWFFLEQHSNSQCTDFTGLTVQEIVNFSDPSWQTISGDFEPQLEGVGSVAVQLAIEKPDGSGSGGLARFDGVVFGSTPDELFSDRFQSPP